MITFWFTCEQDGRTWLIDHDSVLSVRDYITVYYEQNWSTNYIAISSTLNLRFSFCFISFKLLFGKENFHMFYVLNLNLFLDPYTKLFLLRRLV